MVEEQNADVPDSGAVEGQSMEEHAMNEQAYFVDTPWTWRDRLRFWCFPSEPCPLPTAPATHLDCVVVTTDVSLSIRARLRVLVSGKLRVQTRTVTENIVGDTATSSVAYPVWR